MVKVLSLFYSGLKVRKIKGWLRNVSGPGVIWGVKLSENKGVC